jgi:hypothetical protein
MLILIIAGVAVAAIVVVALLATATGVFIRHKITHKLDHHTFEGELVAIDSVPMGQEVEAPEWAHENEWIQEQQKQRHRASMGLPSAGFTNPAIDVANGVADANANLFASANPLRNIVASGEA